MGSAELSNIGLGQSGARFAHDKGVHRLAPIRIWNADHRAAPYAGQGSEHAFDFASVDVFSTRDDQILQPADYSDIPILVATARDA
jgi:hypothetical protein